MKVIEIQIKNFRKLEDIELQMSDCLAAVVVGPNAVGKSSILEAIRLCKSLLMPQYHDEPREVLQSLGALSAHIFGQNIKPDALVGTLTEPLEIALKIELDNEEIATIKKQVGPLAQLHIRNSQGFAGMQDDLGLIQYLSTPEGQFLFQNTLNKISEAVELLQENKLVAPTLIFDPRNGTISGKKLLDQEVVNILANYQPNGRALFSYFPADRAFPSGEVNIQLGSQDRIAQIKSHVGQAALKYQRMKQFIVNEVIAFDSSLCSLEDDFKMIFSELLPGKTLQGLNVNEFGSLSVMVKDSDSERVYDIDSMSSGEKGIVLTFLMMRRNLSPGGLIMIDEPELHLNPAVCKQLLPFLVEKILKPKNIQAIICTHSPDILASAHERADCKLFHLRNGHDISPIYSGDKNELTEALERLGAQVSDVLYSKGIVFVEGEHDAEIIETGFPERVNGLIFKPLKGRPEVEKLIKVSQEAEAKGELRSPQYFIFDLDHQPSTLQSTVQVRVSQWDRYCLENYLLDSDAIYDYLGTIKVGNIPESRGNMKQLIKGFGERQVLGIVARKVYAQKEIDNSGLRSSEIDKLTSYEDIATTLANRLEFIKNSLNDFESTSWNKAFIESCRNTETNLKSDLQDNLLKLVNGKRIIEDIHRHVKAPVKILDFKKGIIRIMREKKSDLWRVVDSILQNHLQ